MTLQSCQWVYDFKGSPRILYRTVDLSDTKVAHISVITAVTVRPETTATTATTDTTAIAATRDYGTVMDMFNLPALGSWVVDVH